MNLEAVWQGLRTERALDFDRLVAEARVVAPGIPIRGPLLGQVLEEESAERLMEEFDLRGMLDIDEGRPYKVGEIEISGNFLTKDKVQKLTDDYIKKIDTILKDKEQDIKG